MNGFLMGFKAKQAQLKANEAALDQYHKDHQEIVRLLKADHAAEIDAIGRQLQSEKDMYRRDLRNINLKLDEAEQKIETFQENHERMEKMLNKLDQRKRIYRDMMKATAAWEEEISLEREEDKLEQFLKWKNEVITEPDIHKQVKLNLKQK